MVRVSRGSTPRIVLLVPAGKQRKVVDVLLHVSLESDLDFRAFAQATTRTYFL